MLLYERTRHGNNSDLTLDKGHDRHGALKPDRQARLSIATEASSYTPRRTGSHRACNNLQSPEWNHEGIAAARPRQLQITQTLHLHPHLQRAAHRIRAAPSGPGSAL